MRQSFPTREFLRDSKRVKKRGWDYSKLEAVILDLIYKRPLSPLRRDHALVGEWAGCRDCHIGGDWVLIYHIDGETLLLLRTGTHSDIGF